MKRFTPYLYEYQNRMRVRNVGFVKVEQTDHVLELRIYGKGFPVSASGRLEIFLFYQNEDKCVGIPIGQLECGTVMPSGTFRYEGETAKLMGVIVRERDEDRNALYVASWAENTLDVAQMWLEEELAEEQEAEVTTEEIVEKKEEEVSQPRVYKITRKDLVQLPRQEWKLANNHFLMHGCRNFHHLISFEKDGKCWLGVPGIYHPQEERAARAFGFVEFMIPEEGELSLEGEEQMEQEEFGYWCRIVNNVIKG